MVENIGRLERGVQLQYREGGTTTINQWHGIYDPLLYVLLFPTGKPKQQKTTHIFQFFIRTTGISIIRPRREDIDFVSTIS